MDKNEPMTAKNLVIMLLAHIDESLLRVEDKITDKKQMYTATEIREQMEDSAVKVLESMERNNYDIDRAIQQRIFSGN